MIDARSDELVAYRQPSLARTDHDYLRVAQPENPNPGLGPAIES
jgi:hypothetical protein